MTKRLQNNSVVDELDRKILAVLDWNGRMPASQIAKLVRSNKDVVISRIRRLEEAKVIANYYPILNLRKLGYYYHRLNFDTTDLTTDREEEFVTFLDKEINAALIYRMDAPFKYGVCLYTKTMHELDGVLLRIKKFLGGQLTAYRYSFYCTVSQYPHDAVFDKEIHSAGQFIDDQPPVHYDAEDLTILRELAANARATTREISHKTGIPQQTVSYKIKILEKKQVILGYRAEIAIQKLGFEHWAVEAYLTDQSQIEQLRQWTAVDPHVTWFETSIGGLDVAFNIEAKDHDEMERQLNELRKRFPNIRKLLHYTERYWKLTYLP